MKDVDLGWTTADAEDPTLSYDGTDLRVEFVDWQEQLVRLVFRNCHMFSWEEIPASFELWPDRTYSCTGSSWQGADSVKPEQLKHWVLCFNASYFWLQVLAERLERESVR